MKTLTAIALLALGLLFCPSPARCYERDVHFDLTYVLCRLGGFNQIEAFIIADADQSLDDNDLTSAFPNSISGKIARLWNQDSSYRWHSLANGTETMSNGRQAHSRREAVTDRRDELKKRALSSDEQKIPKGEDGIVLIKKQPGDMGLTQRKFLQLVKFGQYLHYAQDYYAHREPSDYSHLDAGEEPGWKPYSKTYGHVADGHSPDRIPWRPKLAKAMAAFCYGEICDYSKRIFQRQPYDLSHCEYTEDLKASPFAKGGMSFTDVLINVFAVGYPPAVTQTERPVNPNPKLPPSIPEVPEEADEQVQGFLVNKLISDTKIPVSEGSRKLGYPPTELALLAEYPYLPKLSYRPTRKLPKLSNPLIPPMKYNKDGEINMSEIFIGNEKWVKFTNIN